ncbi:YrrS family protein [Salibacterium qingdaonense]|uniref:DUF1510 domain-containing protein n=1 Tax=Salibacterium qingdaonense TaxID=266892 RepID=A0A1I4JFW3_9BACI|nr:YrrS family protein [Salibacterium qingdaonense]SFL65121.1 Protein of unknown function [Salibacterium qingdaonense]
MNNDQGFNEQNRYEMRRRKRMNRVLNVSILAVGALILFFAVQLFLPGSQETAENDVSEPQQNEETEPSENETTEEQSAPEQEQTAPEENQNTNNQQEDQNQDNQQNENQPQENSDSNDSRSTDDSSSNDTDSENSDNAENTVSIPEGGGPDQEEWEPIGTEQSGSFRHDFDTSSQNWAEMEAALRYAAGLSSGEAETWRIENGGGSNRAVGYISTYENRQTPYKVTIEFVEDEGWKPVNVERADSNPEI